MLSTFSIVLGLMGWLFGALNSIYALLWAIVVIYVLYRVWTHSGKTLTGKVLWTILIVALPILGVIMWLLVGQKRDGRFA